MPIGAEPSFFSFPVVGLPLTSSTYFIYRTQLTIISHEIVTQLYCPATIKAKWFEVQRIIERIDKRLINWRDSLPEELNINIDPWSKPDWNDSHTVARLSLAIQFNSSLMILYRPCLCRFDGRGGLHSLGSQSERSQHFNQKAVEMCIHSARQTISHLALAAKSPRHLYTMIDWWNTVHFICEALSILTLELAYRSEHLPREAAYILEDVKIGLSFLSRMSEKSVSARKAWEIFDYLIRQVAPKINWSVYDVPTLAPIPPGYNVSIPLLKIAYSRKIAFPFSLAANASIVESLPSLESWK
jgi:hypothetical protein